MKPYVKTYHDYFGYAPGEFIPCEMCGGPSVEIHHIRPRSLEKKSENKIENLAALCRECHDKAHSSPGFNAMLKLEHRKHLLKSKHDSGERVIFKAV